MRTLLLLKETRSIEDLLLYRPNISSTDTFNVFLPNHFKITSNIIRTSATTAYCHYDIYRGNTQIYNIGALREKGSLSIRRQTDSNMVVDNNSSIIPVNTQTTMEYEYNNGSQTLTSNNTTISGNDNTSFDRFVNVFIDKYTVTNLKIKTL